MGSPPESPDSSKLKMYIVLLVLDDDKLTDYVNNPHKREESMNAAKLSPLEQSLITTGCFEWLCKYLKTPWTAPVTLPPPN